MRYPSMTPWLVIVAISLLATVACGQASDDRAARKSEGYPESIRQVLAQDSELGTLRNHAPESDTLANAVRRYVRGLEQIDFSSCPPEFADAFGRHREAWKSSIAFFEQFDPLRGEMHLLFDEIREKDEPTRNALELLEKRIWDTWAEVEAAADTYGAGPTEEAAQPEAEG